MKTKPYKLIDNVIDRVGGRVWKRVSYLVRSRVHGRITFPIGVRVHGQRTVFPLLARNR